VNSTEFAALSATALAARVSAGDVSPLDAVAASFERADFIRAGAESLNAILWSDRALAERDAAALGEGLVRAGKGGPLAGVPIGVKDNIATLGLPTTCASRILRGYVSPYEATAIMRLREAGAIVTSKTNMDEFAMGSSTENSAFGPARNPHDLTRVPGGSSGGSAALVAAGITPIALGSETGGSVRQPAAFCGVVGVKPTYGRVSRYGLVAFASSLDQIGPLARNVDDAALAMEIIAGEDSKDSTSSSVAVGSLRDQFISPATSATPLSGMRIGIPAEYFPENLDSGIRELCIRAIDAMKSLGAEIVDVKLPHSGLAIPVYYIIAPAEASSNLARFDGVRYGARAEGSTSLKEMFAETRSGGFGPEVTRRILLGTYVLSAGYYDAYYKKAQAVRALIAGDFQSVFGNGVHALFTPTTPTTAFPIGAVKDPYEMYLSDIFTVTANLAGVPAMSLPIGRVAGLPAGGQIIAPLFGEAAMFRVAYALEGALGQEAHQ
jgi:aspartyl-tRNA(Asn)/glutamyl-tRNA(Gln) amidotransferase subunit A